MLETPFNPTALKSNDNSDYPKEKQTENFSEYLKKELTKNLTGVYKTFKDMDAKNLKLFTNQQEAKNLAFEAYKEYEENPEQVIKISNNLYSKLEKTGMLSELEEARKRYTSLENRAELIVKIITICIVIVWVLLVIPVLALL